MRVLSSILLCLCLGLVPRALHAQLVLSDTLGMPALVRTLLGNGVEVSNINVVCDTNLAIRQFGGSPPTLGLEEGLLMSTGLANEAQGPNLASDRSTNLFQGGYGPLSALTGQVTFDACLIEFDLIPTCDTIGIRYVFASEEYSEYVNTFNDAFAFYVSGPGIVAPAPGQNIALVPGTPLPVSINNINNGFSPAGIAPNGTCVNCAYYVDHTNGVELEFDGFTVPLLATVEVQPCQTYHLTLVIADALDQFYDSGVFLEANGIGCIDPELSISADNRLGLEPTVLVESCQDTGWFSFTLSQIPQDTVKFALTYGGTASMGLDYLPLPDTVIFPPGVDTVHWPVVILPDALVEGTETLIISYQGTQTCSGQVLGDSAEFIIREQPFWTFPLPDTLALCSGGSTTLTLPNQPGWTYQWSDTTGLDTPSSSTPSLSLVNQGTEPDTLMYSLRVEALSGLCGIEDSFWVLVYPEQVLGIQPQVSCANQEQVFQLTGLSHPLSSVSWLMGDGSSSSNSTPTHSYLSPGNFLVEAMTLDQFGCEDTFAQLIQVNPSPDASFTVDSLCFGESLSLSPSQMGVGEVRTWFFGDGQLSGEITPSHLYDSTGSYLIGHLVTNNFGCQDTADVWVEVWPSPSAGFLADSVCLGDSLTLTSISTGVGPPLLPLSWSLNGAVTFTGDTVMTYPASSGLWEVSLIAEDARGCGDTSRRMVRVFNPPQASFVVDSACAKTWQQWSSTSTPGDTSLLAWTWDWGNGSVDSGAMAVNRFDSAGLFPVTHVVVDALGCTDTMIQYTRSFELPLADFRVDSVCLGNESNPLPDSLATDWTHRWIWGDGSADGISPLSTVNYPSVGTYQITHIVQDLRGCADTVSVQTEVFGLPTADFSSSTDCLFQPTAFTNLSFAADWPLVAYQWNFGPAGASTSTNPIVTFDQAGQRPVTLVVTDLFGCRDTLAQSAQVYRPPQAIFSSDTGCVSGPLFFQDQSLPGDAPLLAWDWDLGDGTQQQVPQFEYLYDSVATYFVRLEVTDSLGCRDTLLRGTRIFPLPEVSFTTDPACDGLPVQFISGPQEQGATYRWNFGDGEGSFLPNPQRLYSGAGSYQVFLRVATAAGCADSVEGTVTVYQNPMPSFVAEDVCVGDFTRFQNQSQAGDHSLARYRWSLGDGSNSQAASPTHRYESHGEWRVRLQVTDSYGCRADTALPVKVWAKPNLAFIPDTACAGSPISLLDLSEVPDESIITQRFWTLPGNRRYQGNRPIVAFPTAGPYFIELKVVTNQGCADSLVQEASVYPAPQLSFVFDSVCEGSATQFFANIEVDQSQFADSVTDWLWDWGDGSQQSQALSPLHIYPSRGTYQVSLTAETNRGCMARIEETVPVFRIPGVPRIQEDTVCAGDQGFLLAAPLIRGDSIYWYVDSMTENSFHQGNTWLTQSLFLPEFYWVGARSPQGCESSKRRVGAEIHPDAKAQLFLSDHLVERPDSWVDFEVRGQLPFKQYDWDFGDGGFSSEANPRYQYPLAGRFRVTVWAEDINGCWYGMKDVVEVKELIHVLVPSAFSPNGDLINDEFFLGIQNMQQLDFKVFNRWGHQVFATQEIGFRWDGRHQGQVVPPGVYAYQLATVDLDGREWVRSGTITVVR